MKLKAIVATCALAFAGQAAALTPATVPDVTLFVSGSSALQIMIGQVTKTMFVNGPAGSATATDVFYDGTAAKAAGKDRRGYFGVGAATLAPTLAGKKILLLETATGGSINGVVPVARSTPFATLNMTSCAMPTTALVDAATGISVYSCTASVNRVPDAGISDLDPGTINSAINLSAGTATLTATEMAGLNAKATLAVVMGIPVSSNVPASLQNLSKGQIAGLMNGNIADWSVIEPAATGKSVVICRRGAGSGTQSVVNAQIFGNPCASSPLIPSTYTGTTATLGSSTPVAAGNIVVIENSSSGNVKTCLQTAITGGVIDVTNGNVATSTPAAVAGVGNTVVLPAGSYAIGVLGTDQGTTTNYVFAAVDGVAATVANAAIGAYDLIGEATFNDRVGDATLAAGTAKGDLYTEFATRAGDPAVLGTGGTAGAPIAGVAALSENGWAPSVPFSAANPVLRVGNFGNMCQPFSLLQ